MLLLTGSAAAFAGAAAVPGVDIGGGVTMPVIGLGAAHFQAKTVETIETWLGSDVAGRAIDTSGDYRGCTGTTLTTTSGSITPMRGSTFLEPALTSFCTFLRTLAPVI